MRLISLPNSFRTSCKMWIRSVQFEVCLYNRTHTDLPNWQCLVHTRRSLSFMSLVHRPRGDIWLAVPVENLTQFPVVLFKKAKERGTTYCRAQAVRSGHTAASSQGDEYQHISKHSSSLYSVHVRADGAPTAGLQNMRVSPPVSTFGPSDTVTTGSPRGQTVHQQRSVCVCVCECRERSPVTLYWIIYNQTQAAENGAFTEDKAWGKCCPVYIIMSR